MNTEARYSSSLLANNAVDRAHGVLGVLGDLPQRGVVEALAREHLLRDVHDLVPAERASLLAPLLPQISSAHE
jgi:hypothetical protein